MTALALTRSVLKITQGVTQWRYEGSVAVSMLGPAWTLVSLQLPDVRHRHESLDFIDVRLNQ